MGPTTTCCELCGRQGVTTTEHHLVPREYGGTFGETAHLCIPCHKQVHALFTNEELATLYPDLNSLRNNEKIHKYVKWIRKQPASVIPLTKKSNEKKRKRKR
ncbi:HNH endonuclease [Pseudalkalibacillus sp. R45]|uniref:HNH endonuclease n=1 Tax=Pseudalkalibacillus sp. R45 TaxID=3457433 RepID=UPI003FCE4F79